MHCGAYADECQCGGSADHRPSVTDHHQDDVHLLRVSEQRFRRKADELTRETISLHAERDALQYRAEAAEAECNRLDREKQSLRADIERKDAAARGCLDYATMDAFLDKPGNPNDVFGIRKRDLLKLRDALTAGKQQEKTP